MDCTSLLPNTDCHGQNVVMYQMYVISNQTSLKKKEIDINPDHAHQMQSYLTAFLLLPRSKESISINWGPAKLILVFEQLDVLWINLTNADLILLILCSF